MPPRDEQLSDHWQQWQLSHRRMFLFCNPDVTFSINLRRRGLLTAIYIYIYTSGHTWLHKCYVVHLSIYISYVSTIFCMYCQDK